MIMKLLILGVVGYVIYFFFFKEGGFSKKIDKDASDTMVECEECDIYISVQESIIKEGKYFCSKECAKLS